MSRRRPMQSNDFPQHCCKSWQRIVRRRFFALFLTTVPMVVFAVREHTVHTHGEAVVTLAQEGATILIELTVPGVNAFGFEHSPRNDEQRKTVERIVREYRDPARVVVFAGAAHCRSVDVEVEIPGMDTDDDHNKHGHGDHKKDDHTQMTSGQASASTTQSEASDTHSAVHASYRFECKDSSALASIELRLFDLAPGLHEVELQWVTDRGQGATTLTPTQTSAPIGN